jgi:glycosyltransferase involved in cell wall biosynthesis
MKKISIVIPTCDRFTTLKYTLDSVLEIDDENLEVVVSDNCSTDGTKQYLSSIADRRLKTIHLSSRVGMPENFSSAIQGATGDYILVIGDDDLVIQNNLSCLRKFVEIKNPDIIYSTRGVLYWSGLGENSGQVILHTGKTFTKINSQHLLTTCYQGWLPWTYLPSIYNSIFSRRFLDRYIEHLSGRMFYENTIQLIEKDKEYDSYDMRSKLLSFNFTFFELLTANRSYVLFALKEEKYQLKSLKQNPMQKNRK